MVLLPVETVSRFCVTSTLRSSSEAETDPAAKIAATTLKAAKNERFTTPSHSSSVYYSPPETSANCQN
jgi:hypothetical protein